MSKKNREQKIEKVEVNKEMTLAESKAYRASLYKPETKIMDEAEKREAFRLFWAQEKYKYGKAKDLEEILWVHLKAVKLDSPENFDNGLAHFGLKKIR